MNNKAVMVFNIVKGSAKVHGRATDSEGRECDTFTLARWVMWHLKIY